MISPAALIVASLPENPTSEQIEKALDDAQKDAVMILGIIAIRRFAAILEALEREDDV